MRGRKRQRGSVLLEAMAGLLILSVLGATAMAFLAEHARQVDLWEHRELEMRSADRLMAALAQLERRELEQRIGESQVGQMRILVQRPRPAVFRVAVLPQAGDREILVTLLHRPGGPWSP